MTKKEQALVDAEISALRLRAALSWPREAEPKPKDLQKAFEGKPFGHLEVGWFAHAYTGGFRVSEGCSSSVHHSTSDTTKTSTQGRGCQFHTKRDALLWCHWEMCRCFAKELVRIEGALTEP
jgi:hypothetical protein